MMPTCAGMRMSSTSAIITSTTIAQAISGELAQMARRRGRPRKIRQMAVIRTALTPSRT